MSARATPQAIDRFRRFVATRLALRFEDERAELLSRVLEERAAARAEGSTEAYLAGLATANGEEIAAIAERLTVGETYFFRNSHDLEAFTGAVLPARICARASERRLRILSVGCSSGEEPYTLAMLVRDVRPLAGWDVRIHGFDVNPAAVARARAARYSAWSLRQTPPEPRDRFFRQEGHDFLVTDEVRSLVTVEERNLAADDPAFWSPGAFDVVFCRNVLMYLAPEAVRRIVARIASALAPAGFLFLGHAETLRGVSTEFHLRQTHGTFYYQTRARGDVAPATRAAPPPLPAAPARPSWPETAPAAPEGGWVDAIHDSWQRIDALSRESTAQQPGPAPAGAGPSGDAPGRSGKMAVAHELLERERFLEALATLGPGADQDRDVDALLLRAVLLASSGDLAAAETVCARVLQLDELNAEAHYLRALCRDHGGDAAAAADHDRYALYLDPTFAMPRLHLGLLAKRAGDLDQAQRELSRALSGFASEDGSRILLLGGGFTREGLVALCRAELASCGGTP